VSDVRVLTVAEPWATAIAVSGEVVGAKSVENRSWATRFRGPVYVHAGQRWSERARTDARVLGLFGPATPAGYAIRHETAVGGSPPHPFRGGIVIAVADLVDVHPDGGCCRPWGESSYEDAGGGTVKSIHHWLFEDVRRVAPVPWKGGLGLRKAPAELVFAVGVPQ
jgi:hypothetical protein